MIVHGWQLSTFYKLKTEVEVVFTSFFHLVWLWQYMYVSRFKKTSLQTKYQEYTCTHLPHIAGTSKTNFCLFHFVMKIEMN